MKNRDRRRWWVLGVSGSVGLGMLLAVLGNAAEAAEPPSTVPSRPAEPPPARVQLGTFEALDAGGQVLVRWETSIEWGALGFNLYRSGAAKWQRVNVQPVQAVGFDVGARYQLPDRVGMEALPATYRLEVLTTSGKSEVLAETVLSATSRVAATVSNLPRSEPRVARTAAHRVVTHSMISSDDNPHADPRNPVSGWNGFTFPISDADDVTTAAGAAEGSPPRRGLALAGAAVGPLQNEWVKIKTRARGVHFLRARTIADAIGQVEITEATVIGWISSNPGQIAMYSQGAQVTFIPGMKGSRSGLYFYAESHLNNYASENVYWLKAGQNAYSEMDGGSPPHDQAPGTYGASIVQEDDQTPILPVVHDAEQDFWAWSGLLVEQEAPTASWSFPNFALSRLVRAPELKGTLRLRVHGASSTAHEVHATLNDQALGTRTFSGQEPKEFTFEVTSQLLRDEFADLPPNNQNVLTVRINLVLGHKVSSVYLDSYDLSYTRQYHAPSSQILEAGTDGNTQITSRGFSAADLRVFDISNPRQPRWVKTGLKISKVNNSSDNFLSFIPPTPPTGFASRFVAFDPLSTDVPTVSATSVSRVVPVNLADPATRASYVVITVPQLAAAAQTLAQYRSGQFRTKVVLLDDVFNQFSEGLVTPHAISDFLTAAEANWTLIPRFVALLGDGTYDYRNKGGWGDNLVPPRMIATLNGLFASDSLFGDTRDDQVDRIAVGRISVTTTAQFTDIYNKITAYEAQTVPAKPALKALLIADRSPEAAGDFVAGITANAISLASRYSSGLVYPNPYPHPPFDPNKDPVIPSELVAVRAAIRTAINDGVDFLNYVGHGAAGQFGKAGYLTVDDVLNPGYLSNTEHWPFVLATTCVAGNYAIPNYNCLGEVLTTASRVGAVGVLAPTGLSYNSDAAWINQRWMEIASRTAGGRVGDVWMQVANVYLQKPTTWTEVWMYNLLGDPALEVRVPTTSP